MQMLAAYKKLKKHEMNVAVQSVRQDTDRVSNDPPAFT